MTYNNLTFDGRHCLSDMGLIYVPASTKPVIAPQSVYSYIIGGTSGTAAYGDQHLALEYQRSGIFYPAGDVRNEMEAQTLWRLAAQWLGAGRRKMIFDSEPDKYIIAEAQAIDNDEYGWVDGGIQVTWLCQPYFWSVHPDELTLRVSGDGAASWYVSTSLPAPVDVTILNDGTVPVTSIAITINGAQVSFRGMNLQPGGRLNVHMMTPIGAEITDADGIAFSAMPCMTTFEQLLTSGETQIDYSVGFAADGGSALMTLTGNGCWR